MKWVATILFLLLFVSCSKTEIKNGNNNDVWKTLKVLEYGSNLPIANATVIVWNCTKHDFEFGCVGTEKVGPLTSDAQGNFSFPATYDDIDQIDATHPNYWDASVQYSGYPNMIPHTWARVHLKKINTYPAESFFSIEKNKEMYFFAHFVALYHTYSLSFHTPTDTTVLIRLYGGKEDFMKWKVYEGETSGSTLTEGSTVPRVFNKFDTTDVEIIF